MSFIDFINKLFYKKNNNTEYISVKQTKIKLPTRNDYLNNVKVLEIIDEYKNIYCNILSNKKTLVSKNLNFNDILPELELNAKLLYQACLENEDNNKFFNIFNDNNEIDFINTEIKIVKLELYRTKINSLYEKTKLKLIALLEVKNENKVRFHRHRNSINNEIDNLKNLLNIFLTQEAVIMIKSNAYLLDLKNYINNYEIDNIEKEKTINKRLNKLYNYLKLINPELIDKIKIANTSKLNKIAFIERELELFVYQNPSKINELNNFVNKFLKQNKYYKKNKKQNLKIIEKLENYYQIFDTFGYNLLNEENINNFYKLKFNVLTCDMDNINNKLTNLKENDLVYFENILLEKMQKIITGNNVYFNNCFKEDTVKAINLLKEYLKDNVTNDFKFNKLLRKDDYYIIPLILSFDTPNGFINLFYNSLIKNDYKNQIAYLSPSGVVFKYDTIPLRTYYELYNVKINNSLLFKIYNLWQNNALKYSNYYYLPERIKQIHFNRLQDDLIKKLKDRVKDKIVVFPSTLKYITYNLYNQYCEPINIFSEAKGLILNEGIEKIGPYGAYFNGEEIVIPASLHNIDYNAFNKEKLKRIIFNDYRNSKILKSRDELNKIFFWLFKYDFEVVLHSKNEKDLRLFVKIDDQKISIFKNDIEGQIYSAIDFYYRGKNDYMAEIYIFFQDIINNSKKSIDTNKNIKTYQLIKK